MTATSHLCRASIRCCRKPLDLHVPLWANKRVKTESVHNARSQARLGEVMSWSRTKRKAGTASEGSLQRRFLLTADLDWIVRIQSTFGKPRIPRNSRRRNISPLVAERQRSCPFPSTPATSHKWQCAPLSAPEQKLGKFPAPQQHCQRTEKEQTPPSGDSVTS